MTWTKPVISLFAAGALASVAIGTATAADLSPPLAATVAEGGSLPIVKSEKVYAGSINLPYNHTNTGLAVYADLDNADLPVRWRVAVDGNTRFALMQAASVNYSKLTDVKLVDLTGDGNPELLIYRNAIGPNGGQGLSVYNAADRWLPLFESVNPIAAHTVVRAEGAASTAARYEVKSLGGGRLSFADKTTGLKATIVLNALRYDRDEAKSEAQFSLIGTSIAPISKYEFTDEDADGVQEITSVQRIIGVSATDTIALLKTKYVLAQGAYAPAVQCVTDEKGKVLAQVSLASE